MHFHGQRGLFRFLASQPRFEIPLKNCKFTLRLKQSTFTFENYFQLGRFDFLRSVYFKYYQRQKKKNWEINFSREISNVSIIVILTHGRILDMIAFDCFEQIQQICMQRWTDIYIYIFIIELIIYLRISFLFFPPRPEDRFKKEETAEKRRVKKKKFAKRNIPIGPPWGLLGQQRQTSVWTVVNHPLPQLAIRQTRTRRKKESAKNILGIGASNLVNEQLFPFSLPPKSDNSQWK